MGWGAGVSINQRTFLTCMTNLVCCCCCLVLRGLQANILLTKGFEPKLCDLASSHLLSNTAPKESKAGSDGARRRRISSLHMNMDTSPLYAPPEALDADSAWPGNTRCCRDGDVLACPAPLRPMNESAQQHCCLAAMNGPIYMSAFNTHLSGLLLLLLLWTLLIVRRVCCLCAPRLLAERTTLCLSGSHK